MPMGTWWEERLDDSGISAGIWLPPQWRLPRLGSESWRDLEDLGGDDRSYCEEVEAEGTDSTKGPVGRQAMGGEGAEDIATVIGGDAGEPSESARRSRGDGRACGFAIS